MPIKGTLVTIVWYNIILWTEKLIFSRRFTVTIGGFYGPANDFHFISTIDNSGQDDIVRWSTLSDDGRSLEDRRAGFKWFRRVIAWHMAILSRQSNNFLTDAGTFAAASVVLFSSRTLVINEGTARPHRWSERDSVALLTPNESLVMCGWWRDEVRLESTVEFRHLMPVSRLPFRKILVASRQERRSPPL